MIKLRVYSSRLVTALLVGCLLLASTGSPVLGQEQEPIAPEAAEESLPGLEEVAPKATELAAKAAKAEQMITAADLSRQLAPRVEALAAELAELERRMTGWDRIGEWRLNHLLEARSNYLQLERKQLALQEKFSQPLKTLEALHETWSKEQKLWENWQASLRETWQVAEAAARIQAPREAFERSLKLIQGVIAQTTDATNRLLDIQQEFLEQQGQVASRIGSIDGAIGDLRQETFRRNAYPLFSPAFYQEFSEDLLSAVIVNFKQTFHVPTGFLKNQGWVAVLQCIAVVVIGTRLSSLRKRKAPVADQLKFLIKNPWAGGIFLGVLLFIALYTNSPPLWRWLMTVVTLIPATILVVAMYRKALVRRIVRALAVIYLLSETLILIGLPRPLQQVYLSVLCLFVIVACVKLARQIAAGRLEASNGLVTALYLGAMFGAAGLIGEVFGYATFSANLVEAVLGTIILILVTHMAVRLSDGVIATVMQKERVRSLHLVSLLGTGTTRRLQNLMHIFLLTNAFVYLFVVWNVFDRHKEALEELLSWEFAVGEFSVTMQMLVLLLLVLYLTNMLSWILQGLVEAYYMTPRSMEYGVKTALKRLLHYALFTIGFFIAISMAGLDLQKFTIIAGALGVGIGFGLQNIVNNFVSGLIMLFERPVKVGDMILLDGQWGTITNIGLRSTVVETFDLAEIIVPNSDLISQKVVNWTLSSSVSRVVLPVGVAYGSRLETVLEVLTRVAMEHSDILEDPEPSAIFTGFGNSSIDFELRAWIPDINLRLKVKSELGRAVDEEFRKAGITIPFPQMDLHLKSIETDLQALFARARQEQPE